MGLDWNVKISTYNYQTPSGAVIPMSYVSPIDLLTKMVEQRLDVLVGGLQSQTEISEHLVSFWKAFQLTHSDHMVFEEHSNNLERTIPLAWHGDEGRGKRRGNTVVVSCQSPIGITTVLPKNLKRKYAESQCECGCNPPDFIKQQFNQVDRTLSDAVLEVLGKQWTNVKGHSFLQHWALFIIPSWVHHEYPDVLPNMLEVIAADFRRLFFEGVTVRNKHFCFAIIAAKGDLKWFCKIALQRSFQNQGRVRDQACCHECMAGEGNLTWEDMSQQPVWWPSRFSQRPWTTSPPMNAVPYCRAAPEKQYKRDVFHCAKLGIFRDLVGSAICWLCQKGYYNQQGDFSEKLNACHSVFRLFCMTTGSTPALRSFSRALLMVPRFEAYPWANVKASDTMLLLRFLSVQCEGFIAAPLDPSHVEILKLVQKTCQSALGLFRSFHHHGIWFKRVCAMTAYLHITRFIVGYATLASRNLNDPAINAFGMKPKLHLMKHAQMDLKEWLQAGFQAIPNFNMHACDQDEDYIGRTCRLSRRLDSRRIGERVLSCCLMKSSLLYKKFLKQNKLAGLGRCGV